MAKVRKDQFINRAIQRIVMSAANTLTFQQINFAVGVFQGVALIIHRIVYHVGYPAFDELLQVDDVFQIGLSVSNQITTLAMRNPEMIDQHEIFAYVQGVATVSEPHASRLITDFSALPGGGMLVAANPIYIAMDSFAVTSALDADVEILFTFKELSDADYIELIQSRIQANI